MNMLWSALNNLQLINHMILLNLVFPSNAVFFSQLLIDFGNFKIINTNDLIKKIFPFLNEFQEESNDVSGYELKSLLENAS